MKTLRDAAIGSDVVVKKLHGEGAVKRRIGRDHQGCGDLSEGSPRRPMELTVRGYELSLRKEDAEKTKWNKF